MKKELGKRRQRGEIRESVDQTRKDIDRFQDDLGRERDDIVVTRETLDELEAEGTEEGAREVREAIDRAEEVTTELFDKDGESLMKEHEDGQDNETRLEESSDSVERDTERIADAMGRIDTRENLRELDRALDHARGDKEFLERHIENLEEAIRQSEVDYQALHDVVHGDTGRPKEV